MKAQDLIRLLTEAKQALPNDELRVYVSDPEDCAPPEGLIEISGVLTIVQHTPEAEVRDAGVYLVIDK